MTGDRQYYHIHGCKALPGSVPLIELPPSSAESCRLLELRSAKQKSILSQIRHFDHGTNSNSLRSPAYLPACELCMPARASKAATLHISMIIGAPRSLRSFKPQQLGICLDARLTLGHPASSVHCCGLHPARDIILTVCFCFNSTDPSPESLLVRSVRVDGRVISPPAVSARAHPCCKVELLCLQHGSSVQWCWFCCTVPVPTHAITPAQGKRQAPQDAAACRRTQTQYIVGLSG